MQNNPARYITDYVFNKHITMISEEFRNSLRKKGVPGKEINKQVQEFKKKLLLEHRKEETKKMTENIKHLKPLPSLPACIEDGQKI